MNKRQAKKKRKKSVTYITISSSKRDRNHRIPKKKAVVLKMGGPCGVITRNCRVYPESVVKEAIRKANFDCNHNDPQWISGIEITDGVIKTPPITLEVIGLGNNRRLHHPTWSIRGISTHPNN